MNFRKYNAIGITSLILILCACGGGGGDLPEVVCYSDWNNPISVSEVVKDAYVDTDQSPLISSGTVLLINADNLYIEDYNSGDKIIHVIDIPGLCYKGAFGKFGEGPTEIVNPGNIFSPEDGWVAVFDYGHWDVKSFNVDSALNSENYIPQTLVKLSEHVGSGGFPDRFVPVDDGWGFARLIETKERGGYTQSLCRFDLTTGAIEPFGVHDNPPRFKSSVAASYDDGVVAEVSSNQDLIRLYDLSGNLKLTIRGPLYEDQPSRGRFFYSKAVIGDGKLFAVYSGENSYVGRQIIVLTLDGEYLRTYDLPDLITDIAYSDKYNRLYLSLDGERQFVYIPIGEESTTIGRDNRPSEAAKAKETAEEENKPILTLIDPDNLLETVPVDEAHYRWYKNSDSDDAAYNITVFNQTRCDTIMLDSITADIQCRIRHWAPRVVPRLMFLVTMTPDVPICSASQDVKLTFHYNREKQQTLTVKLLNEAHKKSPIKSL